MPVDESAISWNDSTGFHIHVYSSDGTTVTEEALDPGPGWGPGALSVPGATVGATSWVDSSQQSHLRVYVANASTAGSMISEYTNDGAGWNPGTLSVAGTAATATSWVDGSGASHIRVYVQNGSLVEYCWDNGSGWPQGSFPG